MFVKDVRDESDEVEALRDNVPLPPVSSSAEAFREEVCALLPQRQLHDRDSLSLPLVDDDSGWLYIQVATRTTRAPRMKLTVIWKWKRATEARKEMTMLRLVAKPFRILSAYLMTRAVSKPPKTWVRTVAHAHTPKFSKRLVLNKPDVFDDPENTTGTSAGSRENSESCTLRTQRSAGEFFRTISK